MSLLVLVVAATLLGSAWGGWIVSTRASRPYRLLLFFLTGLLEIHLLLQAMSFFALPWRRGLVAAGLAALYLGTRSLHRRDNFTKCTLFCSNPLQYMYTNITTNTIKFCDIFATNSIQCNLQSIAVVPSSNNKALDGERT